MQTQKVVNKMFFHTDQIFLQLATFEDFQNASGKSDIGGRDKAQPGTGS